MFKFKTRFKLNKTCFKCQFYCVKSDQAAPVAAKKFQSIPGPKGPFGLGSFFNYIPVLGAYKWSELHKAGFQKYYKYGPIVREKMLPGVDIVWLFDPNDIAKVLNDFDPQQQHFPMRRSHLALKKFRDDRPHIYKSGGLLPTNGPEWWRLRSELQKGLSSPKNVRSFLPDVDRINREFCDNLKQIEVFDIMPELARLNLELICLFAFDERMDSFSEMERRRSSKSSRLIRAAENTNRCILPTDQGFQLWQYFETPTYKKLKKSQIYMQQVAIDLVFTQITFFKEQSEKGCTQKRSLVEEYLKNSKLDLSDIVGMSVDLLLAGIDTTTYSTSFILYHLAHCKIAQDALYHEALKVLPNKEDDLSTQQLNFEVPYARAVVKESLRLNPISVGVGRILNKNTILSGYSVPKNTVVVTQNMIACRLPENFENPDRFEPERWLNRNAPTNPYLVLPFGHGMRSCIARRMAEQNMIVFILRLIRRFEIEWCGGSELDVKTFLINKPDQPIKISLKPRQ